MQRPRKPLKPIGHIPAHLYEPIWLRHEPIPQRPDGELLQCQNLKVLTKATLVNVLASSALIIQTITAFTLAVEGTRIIDANAACTANVKLLGALKIKVDYTWITLSD